MIVYRFGGYARISSAVCSALMLLLDREMLYFVSMSVLLSSSIGKGCFCVCTTLFCNHSKWPVPIAEVLRNVAGKIDGLHQLEQGWVGPTELGLHATQPLPSDSFFLGSWIAHSRSQKNWITHGFGRIGVLSRLAWQEIDGMA